MVAAMGWKPPPSLVFTVADRLTSSWTAHRFGVDHLRAAARLSPSGSIVVCLWHQSLLAVAGTHRGLRIAAVASLSGDGAIIADVLGRFGMRTVRGSAARGGPRAAKELMTLVDDGWLLCFAVDGPRGPAKEVKPGPVDFAGRHGLPILPVAVRAVADVRFKRAWDRFRLPLPRTHLAVAYGAPLLFPTGACSDDELLRRRKAVALAMHRTEALAATHAGRADRWPRPEECAWLAPGAGTHPPG
jgi:hypothetical protein